MIREMIRAKACEPGHSLQDSWAGLSMRKESNAVATDIPSRRAASLTQQPRFSLGLSGRW